MAYNIFTIPVVILFISNGFAQFFYALKLNKKFPKEHNIPNSIMLFFLWILAGMLYPFFFLSDNANILWFQCLSAFFICFFTPFILFLILYYQYRYVIRKDHNVRHRRNIQIFLKDFDEYNAEIKDPKAHSLTTDVHRKLLHLIPAGIIIFLWVFAVHIWEGLWNGNRIWGINGQEFGKFLILTAGLSGILIFATLDYVRLSYIFEKRNIYHLLPDSISKILKKTIKRKEIYEFTKPSAMVLAFVPIFFLPFGVFAASALIATIGDGAASIIGMRFGKRHFPKKSKKTILGYVAGFFASFGVSILALWIFETDLMILKIIIISISGAIMFLLIDILSLKIDDNILNPIFCALIMALLYYNL